jgi:hypothetical protein
VCGSLAAAAAVHLVSSYLQSPQRISIPSGLPGVPAPSPQRGDRDHLSVLYIAAPSVACSLSGSLISEKDDTVLFEDLSSWNLANEVGGRWVDPKPIWLYMCVTEEALIFGLDRYTS